MVFMEKPNKRLGIMHTLKKIMVYFDNRYDRLQKEEIVLGLDKGLDTYFYKNPNFDWKQMREIRLGLEKGLEVSVYAKEEFNVEQMEEIRLGQEKKLDVSFYSKPEFDWKQMREIKLGLDKNLDVSTFAKSSLDIEQMEEIKLGLEKGLDVSFYNKNDFNWKQMREIRLGLERGLDVSSYSKDHLSVEQMEKIRVKLEKQSPVINQISIDRKNENNRGLEDSQIRGKENSQGNEETQQKSKAASKRLSKANDEVVDGGQTAGKADKGMKNSERDIENKNKEEDFSFSRYDANVVLPMIRKAPSTKQLQKLFQQRYRSEEEANKQSHIFEGRIRKLTDRGYLEEKDGTYSITEKGAQAAKEVDRSFKFTSYDANVVFGYIQSADGALSLGKLYGKLEEKYSDPEEVEKQFTYLKNRLEKNLQCGYVLKDEKGAYSISEIGEMKAEEIAAIGEEVSISIDRDIEEMEF
ncbi:hypothetical protein Clos_1878 [Alkaliphilus oremlandii OhILAs]|uniref:Uncharacterized protein n=2 Tax=Alkaliphilus oremlandii TaxID=461876 RepID=A8MHY6_ALKOO|nr:hypothetical protein Clos_1878 [Alkaliphilus oremlandii OhILAs]